MSKISAARPTSKTQDLHTTTTNPSPYQIAMMNTMHTVLTGNPAKPRLLSTIKSRILRCSQDIPRRRALVQQDRLVPQVNKARIVGKTK